MILLESYFECLDLRLLTFLLFSPHVLRAKKNETVVCLCYEKLKPFVFQVSPLFESKISNFP